MGIVYNVSMKLKYWHFALIIFGCCSCSQQEPPASNFNVVEIAARDDKSPQTKPIIYRVKVPKNWTQQNPSADVSIVDTTKSITEFYITEEKEKIRIAIHNFPSDSMDQRIPPQAQLSRWKKQFQSLDHTSVSVKPQAFGGYSGLLLEATGHLQGIKTSILGWSLQLAPEHYRALSYAIPPTLIDRYRQMRGDVTIKAVGPQQLMAKYRDEIISFARSFQLIDDIPHSSL